MTTDERHICVTRRGVNNNGSCNFCTRNTERCVWEISSYDENITLVIRICDACMKEIKEGIK